MSITHTRAISYLMDLRGIKDIALAARTLAQEGFYNPIGKTDEEKIPDPALRDAVRTHAMIHYPQDRPLLDEIVRVKRYLRWLSRLHCHLVVLPGQLCCPAPISAHAMELQLDVAPEKILCLVHFIQSRAARTAGPMFNARFAPPFIPQNKN